MYCFLQAHEHKGANHLLIREGSKFSYVLVPSYLSSQKEEPDLCFTNHNNSKWDPRVEQCCLREDGHVHAHVHHGDLIEDILLEQVILICKAFPWLYKIVGFSYSANLPFVDDSVHG